MIELIQVDGTRISIHAGKIASVSIKDFCTRVAVEGDWVYSVQESYKEVLQKIRDNALETK